MITLVQTKEDELSYSRETKPKTSLPISDRIPESGMLVSQHLLRSQFDDAFQRNCSTSAEMKLSAGICLQGHRILGDDFWLVRELPSLYVLYPLVY